MIGPFEVVWSHRSMEDWLALTFENAEAVARAVRRFAESGEGMTIHVGGEYRPFVGSYVVAFLIDGDTLHVDRVRRT
jgi:hypothetical protein